jgi:hypothetical protein
MLCLGLTQGSGIDSLGAVVEDMLGPPLAVPVPEPVPPAGVGKHPAGAVPHDPAVWAAAAGGADRKPGLGGPAAPLIERMRGLRSLSPITAAAARDVRGLQPGGGTRSAGKAADSSTSTSHSGRTSWLT